MYDEKKWMVVMGNSYIEIYRFILDSTTILPVLFEEIQSDNLM